MAAAKVAGLAPSTIRAHAVPDAFYSSEKGDKRFPLYTAETIEAFRATWRDGRKSSAEL
jgi:hypothetical protein